MQYLAAQLMDHATLDLLVLKEVVARMTGIEALPDLSEAQLEAAAGGPTLRAEAAGSLIALPASSRAKAVAQLRDAFTDAAGRPLLAQMLLLIAQARCTPPTLPPLKPSPLSSVRIRCLKPPISSSRRRATFCCTRWRRPT